MAWKIELEKAARRDLAELDTPIAKRILTFLHERVAKLDDPRSIGQALTGPRFGELWKYRVGDWLVIAKIQDADIRILVVRIGNRREVYR
ncbi:type II toxin-antitoxin system RelE family toxin [Methylomagnum sp.]